MNSKYYTGIFEICNNYEKKEQYQNIVLTEIDMTRNNIIFNMFWIIKYT